MKTELKQYTKPQLVILNAKETAGTKLVNNVIEFLTLGNAS